MASYIGRRKFLATLLGGATAAWPLAARAQQSKRMRRIGVLMPYAANDPQVQSRNAAFLQGLQQLGWTVGTNVAIDYRWSAGNEDDTRKYAAELVALAPDVIFASGSTAVGPLQRATRSVPIVFALAPDPVGAGFVDSLARPGANITGFTPYEYGIGVQKMWRVPDGRWQRKVSKRLPLPKLRPQPHSQVMDNGIATSSGAVDLS